VPVAAALSALIQGGALLHTACIPALSQRVLSCCMHGHFHAHMHWNPRHVVSTCASQIFLEKQVLVQTRCASTRAVQQHTNQTVGSRSTPKHGVSTPNNGVSPTIKHTLLATHTTSNTDMHTVPILNLPCSPANNTILCVEIHHCGPQCKPRQASHSFTQRCVCDAQLYAQSAGE
jgi:hypothetical protein